MNATVHPEFAITDLTRSGQLKHVALIMDGNRRWAKASGKPTLAGHKAGVDALRKIVRHAGDVGLQALTVYAFSTENWNRSPMEVQGLMQLFVLTMGQEIQGLKQNNVCVRFLGDFTVFASNLQAEMKRMEAETAACTGLKFQIAMNYGSRAELVQGVKAICQQVLQGSLTVDAINEATMNEVLYTQGLPDPDVLIRTGGEYRISNYLLWQAAYAELVVVDEFWPDFSPIVFNRAIEIFAQRSRRFGQ